ncbi:GNAT family N-acetyltransferase [Candidatus Chloroploca asiatica]|uniref:N-acetyltransferase domain-containing protein n=1 Tax=Candidatus Chloroploca asiatica TaxID=1506545 RepID=A0A2H3KQD9_9CHLR|nr:hypothetical protein A9Q02_18705 [Candidatus Chloroploca asiatica]
MGGQTRLRAFASHKTALGHIAFAAFCTLWYDEATRTVAFEPVGTHPEHQRTGLGKALMAEGLRRVPRSARLAPMQKHPGCWMHRWVSSSMPYVN